MSRISIFTDIQADKLVEWQSLVELGGGTSAVALQADGRFTLTATYPGDEPAQARAAPARAEFEWMPIARAEVGIRELDGRGDNPRILEYQATTNGLKGDEVPWCSSFVNYCVVNGGYRGTNSARARSWLDWGMPAAELVPGCIVVLPRGSPQQGHVGFYVGMRDAQTLLLLGGNQSNTVGIAGFPLANVIGKRIPAPDSRIRQPETAASRRWDDALAATRTSGASAATAAQDGLAAGVEASKTMALHDLARLPPLAPLFNEAGARHALPPALLAAIASRESRMGVGLRADGFGTDGHAFGIMQVDRRSHVPRGDSPSSMEHIDQATGILADYRRMMLNRHGDWSDEQILRGAVASYNCGPGRVNDPEHVDAATTGGDYSADVVVRAQVFIGRM